MDPVLFALLLGPAVLLIVFWRQYRAKLQQTYRGFGAGPAGAWRGAGSAGAQPPPVVKGLPLLGNVLDMRQGAAFVQECHKKVRRAQRSGARRHAAFHSAGRVLSPAGRARPAAFQPT